MRQYGYCWCDCEAGASFGRGFLVPFYVIELEVSKQIGLADESIYVIMHPAEQRVEATF